MAQNDITISEPDYYGRTTVTFEDDNGEKITAIIEEPDYFDRVRITYKDEYGNKIGTSVTDKADFFNGDISTEYKDEDVVKSSVTSTDFLTGNIETRFKDKNGRTIGIQTVYKPDPITGKSRVEYKEIHRSYYDEEDSEDENYENPSISLIPDSFFRKTPKRTRSKDNTNSTQYTPSSESSSSYSRTLEDNGYIKNRRTIYERD